VLLSYVVCIASSVLLNCTATTLLVAVPTKAALWVGAVVFGAGMSGCFAAAMAQLQVNVYQLLQRSSSLYRIVLRILYSAQCYSMHATFLFAVQFTAALSHCRAMLHSSKAAV
jgi:hypothetical protein